MTESVCNGLWLLTGLPVFKKVLVAFYVVAGVAALAALGWYLLRKRSR